MFVRFLSVLVKSSSRNSLGGANRTAGRVLCMYQQLLNRPTYGQSLHYRFQQHLACQEPCCRAATAAAGWRGLATHHGSSRRLQPGDAQQVSAAAQAAHTAAVQAPAAAALAVQELSQHGEPAAGQAPEALQQQQQLQVQGVADAATKQQVQQRQQQVQPKRPVGGPRNLPSGLKRARADGARLTQQLAATPQQQQQRQQQQRQQQQQWQWQQPVQQAGSRVQQRAQQAVRQPAAALYVTMSGELHMCKEFPDSDYKILSFREVSSCSNGHRGRDGWQPEDVDAALAALNLTSSSSNARSSNRSTTSSNPYAAKAAAKWLKVVGEFSSMQTGLAYKISGEWTKHAEFGWQIKALPGCCEAVTDAVDPMTFLTSLKGVGTATAERIISVLGPDMDSITEALSQPQQQAVRNLMKVPKIGRNIALNIKHSWDAKMEMSADRQAELQRKAGLSPRLANSITQFFGPGEVAVQRLAENPYAPYRMVQGYTLEQAEETAQLLGFGPSAPERGAAYLQQTLLTALDDSMTCFSWSDLEQRTLQTLHGAAWQGWPQGQGLRAAAEVLVNDQRVVVEETHLLGHLQQHHQHQHQRHHQQQLYDFEVVKLGWSDDALVYLRELHAAEQDTVDYCLAVAKVCCEVLQQLQQHSIQQEQQQQEHAAGAGRSTQHRRSHRSHSAAAAEPASASTITSSSKSSSSGALQLPVVVDDEMSEVIDLLEEEMSEQLGKPVKFNEGQRVALVLSQLLPVMALTGGPGCGKTLVSQAIARRWLDEEMGLDLYMAAPTGRAAQRLQEVLSGQYADEVSASTIHRLLGYRNAAVQKRLASDLAAASAGNGKAGPEVNAESDTAASGRDLDLGAKCEYNSSNPLPCANYLVDEVSMMDTALAAALFNALGGTGTSSVSQQSLMLVGDPDQLPPVGPGQPVADALAEGMLPCIDLRQIYRTAANSAIVTSAHAINNGQRPVYSAVWDIHPGILRPGTIAADIGRHVSGLTAEPLPEGGVLLLRLPDSSSDADVAEALLQATQQLVPRLDCDMKLDVQVLTPLRQSQMGVEALNATLQPLFNPKDDSKRELITGRHKVCWREGDRVTHLKNDTQLDVYNGDQGYIERIQPSKGIITVRYPPRSKQSKAQKSSSSSSSSLHWDLDNDDSERDDECVPAQFHCVNYHESELSDMLQQSWATTVHKVRKGEQVDMAAAGGAGSRFSSCDVHKLIGCQMAAFEADVGHTTCSSFVCGSIGPHGMGLIRVPVVPASAAVATVCHAALCCVPQAQGGEFPVVLLGVHKRAGRLLRRQLLYTAVSRAQKLLIIVGTDSAISKCLQNTGHVSAESSRFRDKLRSARVKAGLPTIQRAVFGPDGWSS